MCRQSTIANLCCSSAVRNASLYQYKASYTLNLQRKGGSGSFVLQDPSKTTKSDLKQFEVRSCCCRLVSISSVQNKPSKMALLKSDDGLDLPDYTKVRLLDRKGLTHSGPDKDVHHEIPPTDRGARDRAFVLRTASRQLWQTHQTCMRTRWR